VASRLRERVRRQKAEVKSHSPELKSNNGFGHHPFESVLLVIYGSDSADKGKGKRQNVCFCVCDIFYA